MTLDRYEIVRPHQLAVVHQLLYASFYVDEPMTRHLGLCQVGVAIIYCVEECIFTFLTDATSVQLILSHDLS